MSKETGNLNPPELATLRTQIDSIDDQLCQLLEARISLVDKVGELKRHNTPGACPIRPAREAQMVRRITETVSSGLFPPAAAAAMWRTLIGACITVEAPLIVSVYASEREEQLIWLAREYYGPFVTIIRQPHIKRVIGDILDGKATVGVVPMLHTDDTTYWWTNLLQGDDLPKVFAQIPFAITSQPGRNTPTGLAIGRVTPENSGDDNTLLVLEADANVSHSKLQTAIAASGMEASWLGIATLQPSLRHHLLEVRGFMTHHDEAFQTLLNTLKGAISRATILGSYANPIHLYDKAEPKAYVAGSAGK